MKFQSTRWTAFQDSVLTKMWMAKESGDLIARSLGKPKTAIYERVRTLKLPKRAANDPVIVERRRAGMLAFNANREWVPPVRDDDEGHWRACARAGGFPALSERRLGRGQVAVCAPLFWPARAA